MVGLSTDDYVLLFAAFGLLMFGFGLFKGHGHGYRDAADHAVLHSKTAKMPLMWEKAIVDAHYRIKVKEQDEN